ncbi:MAG: hypothetical protein ACRDJM_01290 [Actinomycetota bacterium]
MRKLLALSILLLSIGLSDPADAGTVCVNGFCVPAPFVHARATVSLSGLAKVDGGFDGGPGIAPTGFHDLVVKADNVRLQPVFNGQEQGWYGITIDYGQREMRFWLGANGCYLLDNQGFRSCQFDDD